MYNYYDDLAFQGWDERHYEEYLGFPEYQEFGGGDYPFQYYRAISMQEAMNIALSRVPGQVVKIELEQEHGKTIYEVEVLTAQGVKYELDIDSNTGQILKFESD
ncbi:PepSY domain-containing protein [Aciduricibacillus chroicocephali]|uniref:PepSY domain-containing protein n=1 Tax=Aciduricibacillus chroicocephali TaxID=3054939 RepID=A0ABY9KUI3_9BACI|nr:PepSY domain-containing protein [Bacillaceae bacterium 44XB]